MITYKSEQKNPLIDRVCPMCRTYGTNVKFMDLHDDNIDVSLTIVTCLTCRAVYSIEMEEEQGPDTDEEPIP